MTNLDTNVFAEVAPAVVSGVLFGTLVLWGIASTVYRSKKDVTHDANMKLKDKQR